MAEPKDYATVNLAVDAKRLLNIAHAFTGRRHTDIAGEAIVAWCNENLPADLVKAFDKAANVPAKVKAER